jgi:predicted TIM-barrel fold metal-dependent hydrolase
VKTWYRRRLGVRRIENPCPEVRTAARIARVRTRAAGRRERSDGRYRPIARLAAIEAAAVLIAPMLLACHSPSVAARPAAGPVRALAPFVDAHTHFESADVDGSVRAAVAALERQNAAMILVQVPPDTFDHPGRFDAEVLLPEVKKHPGKLGVLGGGGTLNAMIIQSAASGDAGPAVHKAFRDRADELLRAGVVGFGEMTAEHYSGGTPYQYAPADHPLYLLLADIAAEHGVPIVLHMEAVPEDMPLPARLKSPPNPPRLHANIAAFERLLAHNPRAKIIWAHAGSDGTGYRTPDLCRELLRAHANLYMEIKTDPRATGLNYPLAEGKLKPEWLAVFTEFPDRFILGSDQHYPEPQAPEQRWQELVLLFNQLPADVKRKIGTENIAHIYGRVGDAK